ncbi:hypothetical protein [Streptomyces sedi]|uniref:Uncharacterized protein n=1 Tax=Streptomyces sedi TaxID=555059 RepID=A0A5C4V875_9ACTN|nr:hypothetical protein [Streptomyces sedi]TNM32098.1 hypothetical protein FH715_06735 [Streptomyces sedi]
MRLHEWLADWHRSHTAELARRGFSLEEPTASEPEAAKPSLTAYFESEDRGVQVTAWSSGEVQFSTVDYAAAAEPTHTYHESLSPEQLEDELNERLNWARPPDPRG